MRMKIHRPLAGFLVVGALLASTAAANYTPLTLRVEGQTHTLLPRHHTMTLASTDLIDKDGKAADNCPGDRLIGALELATKGRWDGSYYSGLGYAVNSIRGEKSDGQHDFWTILIDNKREQEGICESRPRRGDDVIFYRNGVTQPTGTLELRVPRAVHPGAQF